ncbi:MAG: hypothetical protein DRP96_09265 [Candidatus Neomarinimicrobiota bacterium]|nr:MAG: hypothetical protein DRP96_09265 [Candidatus Neomarinimicrobiota bacterium]
MRKSIILIACLSLIGCGTVKKLLKKDSNDPESTRKIIENISPVSANIPMKSDYTRVKSPVHFLPSYRDIGGPHLKIDSLRAIIPLDDETLREIVRFSERKEQSGLNDSVEAGAIKRYYEINVPVTDILSREVKADKVADKPHFVGLFDSHGNLLKLEYFGNSSIPKPKIENLKSLYASYWNLFLNRRVNYIDDHGNRPEPHIRFYSDAGKNVHRVEYLNADKEVIATGDYTFGIKYLILEQRITMPKGGKLTDLHPDYFYRQFDRVEPGWVIKCLYEDKDKLSDLIVMQDGGMIFYRYHFDYSVVRGETIVEAFVWNSRGKMAGRYELYFDSDGNLIKKILISDDRKIAEYSLYTVDAKNLKMIVDTYGSTGKNISRIYRDL